MQLCHEPAPLRKARQIDSEKRSILTELATRRCGKDLLQAESMGWAPPPPQSHSSHAALFYPFPATLLWSDQKGWYPPPIRSPTAKGVCLSPQKSQPQTLKADQGIACS